MTILFVLFVYQNVYFLFYYENFVVKMFMCIKMDLIYSCLIKGTLPHNYITDMFLSSIFNYISYSAPYLNRFRYGIIHKLEVQKWPGKTITAT